MKNIITLIALIVSLSATAAYAQMCEPSCESDGQCLTTPICKPKVEVKKKPRKKKVAKPPVVVPAPVCEAKKECCGPAEINVQVNQAAAPAPTVVVKHVDVHHYHRARRAHLRTNHLGVRAAMGLGCCSPYTSALLGFRVASDRNYLGLDVYSAFNYGVGAQVLLYGFRSHGLNVHVLDVGVLATGGAFDYLSASDVPRRVDLTLGFGVESRLTEDVSLTVDWRWVVPSPSYLARHGGKENASNGRYLDTDSVVWQSFRQSQVLLGIMVNL